MSKTDDLVVAISTMELADGEAIVFKLPELPHLEPNYLVDIIAFKPLFAGPENRLRFFNKESCRRFLTAHRSIIDSLNIVAVVDRYL